MKRTKTNGKVQLTGFLIGTEKDKSGNIIQISLETDDFEQYILVNNGHLNKLIPLIKSRVKVQGKILETNVTSRYILSVENLEPCNSKIQNC